VNSAKKCIDLCVYCITCSELADVIVRLSKLGVQVRVITDREQLDASGSQVGYFRIEGLFAIFMTNEGTSASLTYVAPMGSS